MKTISKAEILTIGQLKKILSDIPSEHDDKTVWAHGPDCTGYPVKTPEFGWMTLDSRGSQELAFSLYGCEDEVIDQATKTELDEAKAYLDTLSKSDKRAIERILQLRPFGILDEEIKPDAFELLVIVKIIKNIPNIVQMYENEIELQRLRQVVDVALYGKQS